MKKEEGFNVEGSSESNRMNYEKYLIIIVIIVLICLVVFVVYEVYSKNGDNNNGNNSGSNGGVKLKSNLLNCLEKDGSDSECEKIFFDAKIYANCESLGELQDRCFYHSAIYNNDNSFCWKIINPELKTKCESKIFITGDI